VRVHVLTNALVRDRAITSVEISGRPVEFSVVDLERLFRASRETVTRDMIEIWNFCGWPFRVRSRRGD
jgi:hypothetical protein